MRARVSHTPPVSLVSQQGVIQAKLLLKQEEDHKKQLLHKAEKNKILEEKGVPEEHFLRKKRLQQFQDMLEQFKKKQEEKRLDIVEKLVREEKLNKQLKNKESQVKSRYSTTKGSGSRRKKISETLSALETGTNINTDPITSRSDTNTDVNTNTNTDYATNTEGERASEGKEKVTCSTDQPPSDYSSDTEPPLTSHPPPSKKITSVIEPEIKGLWDTLSPRDAITRSWGQKTAGVNSGRVELGVGARGEEGKGEGTSSDHTQPILPKKEPSKAEMQLLKKAMEKLKKSKIRKQIAAGKEFKVTPL